MDTGLFEALPDALLIVDAEGRILRANANAHRLFGHSEGSLVGLAVEALMPETARGRHREHRMAYAAAPRVRPMGAGGMALVGQRRNGEQFPVEIALAPLAAAGEFEQFLASVRDISETLRARQALERARYDRVIADLGQEALEARSPDAFLERLPHVLSESFDEGVHVALWLRGANEGPRWVSSSSGAGHEIDAGLPSRFVTHEFRVFNLDNGDRHTIGLVSAVAGCRACALAPLLDRNNLTGALIAWSVEPSRFDHDAQHLLQSSATLVSAVLQRSRTEAQLAHAQRLDSLGQLTGGIAHDFNNLLTVMSGSLQLLAAEHDGTPGSNALIESALRAARRGADLTDKLLSFGRRKQLRPAAIDAARLLEDIRVLLQRTLSDNVQLDVIVPMGLPPTFADAGQLDSALVNLALNARDAMPDGGSITLSVKEHWVPPGGTLAGLAPAHYIAYSVADTGTGMPPDIVARAIEPFFTTKGGRGSGLGLSMVYGFVQQSGGGMTIDSTAGVGTRVSLYLPVAREVLAHRPSSGVPVASAHAARALIVEDDAEVRAIASAFVRSLGYDIVAVPDYDAAVAQLARDRGAFDVVFSDLMLGGGPDGAALAALVRERWPAIGVVVTSGHAHGLEGEQPYEILPKPYDREQLAAALSRCRRSSTAT
ncbi:PAS domain S-box protein [Lysobacter sp. A6]|uniref:histidine kinase n=1 Tax=Noviluteimonas lactosilytica TaxID=2888523 RepID=A0ABS8JM43_9GAMM|nr:PAS domain S-box protein [Lysobacter lactosilyticus]MCC8364664.1 PAS domain S-box protein [Lysobacter lactosilyticus]